MYTGVEMAAVVENTENLIFTRPVTCKVMNFSQTHVINILFFFHLTFNSSSDVRDVFEGRKFNYVRLKMPTK